MRTAQAQRIAREKFSFIDKNMGFFTMKNDKIKLGRLREGYLNNEMFTEIDCAVIDKFYDSILSRKYNLPNVPLHHDMKKK